MNKKIVFLLDEILQHEQLNEFFQIPVKLAI